MNLYPAIDIYAGKCVRLYQGCYQQATIYADDPIVVAKQFAEAGATYLHVVDLDGAKQGVSINQQTALAIAKLTQLPMQFGGGIRTCAQIATLLEAGIARVVLGSISVLQPQQVKNWIKEFGTEKIVLALDVRFNELNQPLLALYGWKQNSMCGLWQLLDEYNDAGLRHVLCTDIQRDGTLAGPNINLYMQCIARYPSLLFQASGGVSSLEDIKKLSVTGVAAAIMGRALYEKNFTLQSALSEVNDVS
jgi:phosphoribosylformimino-5-aminoimidazole carboxamide ribotide isomerase